LIRIEFTGVKIPSPNYEYDKNLKFANEQIDKNKLTEARGILNNLFEKEGVLPDGLKVLARLEWESKNYIDSARAGEKYTQYIPGDTDMLYFTGESYFNAGENEIAISFGEKLRLRDPNDVKTLKLLFNVYHKIKNKKQTAGILNRITEIDPKNADLTIYSNRLNELVEI
jgi:tetratricopeptide (TPR) repeat protein